MKSTGINLKELGKRIRQVRINAGFDQVGFGKKLGVSGNSVSRWEIGEARISLESLYKIKRIYGASLDELLP